MTEPIDWLADGTPYSPRFGDRYHSENGGLDQAHRVFLHGCGLPLAWAGQARWRILETGFGLGLNFLVTWAVWRADPGRPALLHFASCEAFPVAAADLLRAGAAHPELAPLAQQLHDQFWGLLPGVHRLAFEQGRVLLTLYVGDAQAMLRQQMPVADSVYLDGFSPQRNPGIWDEHTLKAVARCCRRGTRLATWTIARAVRDTLAQCGFLVAKVPGVPPKRDNLQATFDPAWEPRAARNAPPPVEVEAPSECLVIGAGLAGASVAASLARRGWKVRVLDRADAPASGASGLPAGLFAPHVSPDDSVLSRLSRSGVRTTLQALSALPVGEAWSPCGVLEHRVDGSPGMPAAWGHGAGSDWSRPADAKALAQAGLPNGAVACWHARAGWVRPARWIGALLDHQAIAWQGGASVHRLRRGPANPEGTANWQAIDAQGAVLAEAPYVVVAAGPQSMPLLDERWVLQPLRGQVSWGDHGAEDGESGASGAPGVWPGFPVNGNGNLVPHIPGPNGARRWYMGSTFERDATQLPLSADEAAAAHAANWTKLQTLLPAVADRLAPAFEQAAARAAHADHATDAAPSTAQDHPAVRAWAGVRCTSHDRLPIAGPVDPHALPGLWVCTAMGARGLTLAPLCGELIAARLHGEPLPLDSRLARALGTERL
ncbi:FAD-dependent 5-carboxymethylaminomethyl-2-thiouridine(34) oxidoreductase MnmC [Acidovorax sp. SUPP3334]|uniref:FAD-dependent 5-carboxymethylaminomethyl-2-thiouridine(34) oxidoreductase MnmC n=1 Tax=Acidovorax sp. SUPP3334 TaxID=2920881 RepID=UPI0023DE67A9|nr:FAD-dependent 5-carboxymethylaminomethyl-2-thiouridine(34) oxidoreductase MnmC [Acidovorax sp. SUPP3334]GKT20673.1 FAD-dependent 5-carboxymethylaminomethyl-2-thiouridine(34) oxidoreductase MnmC [Acidovorax sp. SUPP3334]